MLRRVEVPRPLAQHCAAGPLRERRPVRRVLPALHGVPRHAEADLAEGVERQREEQLLQLDLVVGLPRGPAPQDGDEVPRVGLEDARHVLAEVLAREDGRCGLPLLPPALAVHDEDALAEELLEDVLDFSAFAVVVEIPLQDVLDVGGVVREVEDPERKELRSCDQADGAAKPRVEPCEEVPDAGLGAGEAVQEEDVAQERQASGGFAGQPALTPQRTEQQLHRPRQQQGQQRGQQHGALPAAPAL
mmetsp:Transcript_59192/g.118464  ORF Transcript_59192/g.118464 Transcript_59192/m.118464 type:complete len:246 (-) Transcript_59192:62-799(-)